VLDFPEVHFLHPSRKKEGMAMRIVKAGSDFKKKGFISAVALTAAEEIKPCDEKIIDYACREGNGGPITDGKTTELILIQLSSGRQIAVDIEGIEEDIGMHVN
jgi:hypothetical protein